MREICNRVLATATNGRARGYCASVITNGKAHCGKCGNDTCPVCGDKLTAARMRSYNRRGRQSGYCLGCANTYRRARYGQMPKNVVRLGKQFTFPCGCSGRLPTKHPTANKFVKPSGKTINGFPRFICRISSILVASKHDALRGGGFKPINSNTPHAIIRGLMDRPCVHCGEPLDWSKLGRGLTPHLDHDHGTGEINGFSHHTCNPQGLKRTIERQRKLIKRLEKQR